LLARFDLATRKFETWPIPIEPLGSETPYAERRSPQRHDLDCGTGSDSLLRSIRYTFTTIQLPTRVTFTREIDFDEAGRVWTSNSNLPTWQVEGGYPRVVRVDWKPPAAGATAQAAQP
jgi:hypothetical protein